MFENIKVEIKITDLKEVTEFIEKAKDEIKSLQNALESKNKLVSENMMLQAEVEALKSILEKNGIDERPR